jgi:hypothetical protein
MTTSQDAQEASTRQRRFVIRTSWGFFANSILAAALAVVFARVIEQFGVAGWAAIAGREPVLRHVVTEFGQPGSDVVLLGGTIASLAAGVFFLLIYPGSKDRSAGRLTVLWLILFAFRNAFVDLITIPFTDSSPVEIALVEWGAPAGIDIVLAAAGALGLLLVALAAAPAFLNFNRHRSEVERPIQRVRYIAQIAVLPAIVGPLLAVPFFIPDLDTGYIRSLPLLGLFSLLILFAAPGTRQISVPEVVEERTLSWGLVVAVFVVFLAMQYGLEDGIPIPPWNDDFSWRLRP